MRMAAIVTVALTAAVLLAAPVLAAGTSGKVAAIDGDKVVVLVGEGDGAKFPVGTRGIDIKSADGASIRGKVVAVTGDKVTFRIMRGKASGLAVGTSVNLERAVKAASEEMQGC